MEKSKGKESANERETSGQRGKNFTDKGNAHTEVKGDNSINSSSSSSVSEPCAITDATVDVSLWTTATQETTTQSFSLHDQHIFKHENIFKAFVKLRASYFKDENMLDKLIHNLHEVDMLDDFTILFTSLAEGYFDPNFPSVPGVMQVWNKENSHTNAVSRWNKPFLVIAESWNIWSCILLVGQKTRAMLWTR